MTKFSVLLVIVLIYVLYRSSNFFKSALLILAFLTVNNINIGYFITVAGLNLTYSDIITVVAFICSIIYLSKNHNVDAKTFRLIVMLLLVVVIGVLFLILLPSSERIVNYYGSWDSLLRGNSFMLTTPSFSKQTILQSGRLVAFCVILLTIKQNVSVEDWVDIGKKVCKLSNILIILYVFELITWVMFKNTVFYQLRSAIFGVSVSPSDGRLMGFSWEPSYFAYTVFMNLILNTYLYVIDKNQEDNKHGYVIRIIIFIVLGLFSGAMSFMWCFIVWLIMCVVLNERGVKSLLFKIAMVAIVVFVVTFVVGDFFPQSSLLQSTNVTRLQNIFDLIQEVFPSDSFDLRNVAYSSETTRFFSMIVLLKAWLFGCYFHPCDNRFSWFDNMVCAYI